MIKDLFMAAQELKNNNICHRDIKPSNILYDEEKDRYILTDFSEGKIIS